MKKRADGERISLSLLLNLVLSGIAFAMTLPDSYR